MDKNKTEYYLWIFFTTIVQKIGVKRIPIFAKILSFIFFYLIPIRKSVVINNLQQAFPSKTKNEINKIAYANYLSVGITFMEIMAFPKMTESEIMDLVSVNNLDLIKPHLINNNGIILLTAHIANWELGALVMGILLEKPINVLVKKQRNKLVANWMSSVREKFNNKEVALGASVRELYKTLISGGIVGIVGDQRGRRDDGIIVNFFNNPTYTFQGFASLGIKNRVPIVVVMGERLKSGKYQIHIEEINYNDLPDSLPEKITELNQRYMTILENRIRLNPEQWLWMHKIWKY
jgi:KDO2-lipid IV(A) lauroyltransferase